MTYFITLCVFQYVFHIFISIQNLSNTNNLYATVGFIEKLTKNNIEIVAFVDFHIPDISMQRLTLLNQ